MATYVHLLQEEPLHISGRYSESLTHLPLPWVPDKLLCSFPG